MRHLFSALGFFLPAIFFMVGGVTDDENLILEFIKDARARSEAMRQKKRGEVNG